MNEIKTKKGKPKPKSKAESNMPKLKPKKQDEIKFMCRNCDSVEEVPMQIVLDGVVVNCTNCGSFLVETIAIR